MIRPVLTAWLGLVTVSQAPAGWDATYQRGQQLILNNKTAEAIALFEKALKTSPDFDGASYALADAHRMMALELALKQPPVEATRSISKQRRCTAGEPPIAAGNIASSPSAT